MKADDLIDRMIAAARAEVDKRHPELSEDERKAIADAIGVGALRFFMLRFTRNTVIAFDFQDALSISTARLDLMRNMRRCARRRSSARLERRNRMRLRAVAELDLAAMLEGEEGTSVWEVWLTASRLSLVLEQAIAAAEPAMLSRNMRFS